TLLPYTTLFRSPERPPPPLDPPEPPPNPPLPLGPPLPNPLKRLKVNHPPKNLKSININIPKNIITNKGDILLSSSSSIFSDDIPSLVSKLISYSFST